MTDIDSKRQALATLDSRLAAGEIGGDEYERLRTLLTSGLTPDQCARLGVTSTPAPRSTSGISIGPSGGQTCMPTLAELELAPGTILLNQWRIVRELGRGGFGAVFEADDIKLDRKLAVKVLDPTMAAREKLLARFRREVTLMRELSHERIVRVFDYREEASENLALITMEYVNGCSVRDLLALARASKEKISVELALAIFEQTLEALAAAHAQGVIHRDVTPGNILLAGGTAAELLSDPEFDPRIKLVDFGIAGLVERTELSAKSRVLGTAAYVAPEVLDPDAEITPEADVFGAGAVVYEMLTGKTPMATGYRPVKELRNDMPFAAGEVITSAVRPGPKERPSASIALRAVSKGKTDVARAEKHRRLADELRGKLGGPSDAAESRLALLGEGLRKVDDTGQQTESSALRVSREFDRRLSDIDNVFQGMERRGIKYCDDTVRFARLTQAFDTSVLKARFETEVVAGAPEAVESKVDSMIDWLVDCELGDWQNVVNHVNRRASAHADRMVGEMGGRFETGRTRLLETVGRAARDCIASYDRVAEARRMAGDVQKAVTSPFLLEVGAVGLSAAVALAASSTAADITGLTAAGLMAVLGLFVLPHRRRRAKADFKQRISCFRTELLTALTEPFGKEADRGRHPHDRLDERR